MLGAIWDRQCRQVACGPDTSVREEKAGPPGPPPPPPPPGPHRPEPLTEVRGESASGSLTLSNPPAPPPSPPPPPRPPEPWPSTKVRGESTGAQPALMGGSSSPNPNPAPPPPAPPTPPTHSDWGTRTRGESAATVVGVETRVRGETTR